MGVYKNNLVSIEFTAQEEQQFKDALKTINTLLEGKMINLTPQERIQYGSVHERNKSFVNKARAFVEENPQFVPPFLDLPEFIRDHDARGVVERHSINIASMHEKLRDTKIALDFDNYQASLAIYAYVQLLANQNVPGMTQWYQEMKQFFPRTRRNDLEENNDSNNMDDSATE